MSATLEELLERGEVEAVLLLKGSYTQREREIAREAWEKGLAMGKQIQSAIDRKAGS